MLVLIANADPTAPGADCCGFAIDGELAAPFLLECTEPERCPCQRSWTGLATAGFTPFAEIVERPNLTEADLRRALHDLLDRLGYVDDIVQAAEAGERWFEGLEIDDDPLATVDRVIAEHLAQIREICASFPVGTVVTRLGELVAPAVDTRAA